MKPVAKLVIKAERRAAERRRAAPPPDDWLDLPGDYAPAAEHVASECFSRGAEVAVGITPLISGGTPEKLSPVRLSPLPAGQQDLSRGVIERPDIAELRRLAALPPKNPRPKALTPPRVIVGKPEHADIPLAARATPPTRERVIVHRGSYLSMLDRSEGLGHGKPHRGGYKVC
jgi:hypothetical protein